jgi:hypothetical protein
MRKLIIATTLTLALAITATADTRGAADRGPREKGTPIERVIKAIKRLITTTGLPTVPIP